MEGGAWLRGENLVIEGLDGLDSEAIRVMAPLLGLSVEHPVRVGAVEVVPSAAETLSRFKPPFDDGLAARSREASAFARLPIQRVAALWEAIEFYVGSDGRQSKAGAAYL